MSKNIQNFDCGDRQVYYEQNTSSIVVQYREDCSDEARTGLPSTSTTDENIEAIKQTILDYRRITIIEVADEVSITFGSCQAIFTDVLGMKRAPAKIIPKLLNFEQKQRGMKIA